MYKCYPGGNVGGTGTRYDAVVSGRLTSLHAAASLHEHGRGALRARHRAHGATAFPYCYILARRLSATF